MKFNKITTLSLGALLLSSNFSFASVEKGKKDERKTSRDPLQVEPLYGKGMGQKEIFERIKSRNNVWYEFVKIGDSVQVNTRDIDGFRKLYTRLPIEAKKSFDLMIKPDKDSPFDPRAFLEHYGKRTERGEYYVWPNQIDKFLNDEKSITLKGTVSFQAKGEIKDFAAIAWPPFLDESYDHVLKGRSLVLATGASGEAGFNVDRGEILWSRDYATGTTMLRDPFLAGEMLRALPASAKIGFRFKGTLDSEFFYKFEEAWYFC